MITMRDQLRKTTEALRQLAIVERQQPGVQNAVIVWGHTCRLCKTSWLLKQPESHTATCVLKGSEQ